MTGPGRGLIRGPLSGALLALVALACARGPEWREDVGLLTILVKPRVQNDT